MRFYRNGQWILEKGAARQLVPTAPSIKDLMGKTHTVEVHPDIDHLYNIKGMIQESGRPYLHIGDIKKTGNFGHIVHSIPRDAYGRVTSRMIDQHIEKLPKQKVEIKVVPFQMGMQLHRPDAQEYVASVGFHPDTLRNMHPTTQKFWDQVRTSQHQLGGHEPWVFDGDVEELDDEGHNNLFSPEQMKALRGLTRDEQRALGRFSSDYDRPVTAYFTRLLGWGPPPPNITREVPPADIPVHHLNTYHKRPRQLGMKLVPKASVIGGEDTYDKVQYGKLYKKLISLQELLKKI